MCDVGCVWCAQAAEEAAALKGRIQQLDAVKSRLELGLETITSKRDTAKQSLQETKATLQATIHTAEDKEHALETRLAEVTLPPSCPL